MDFLSLHKYVICNYLMIGMFVLVFHGFIFERKNVKIGSYSFTQTLCPSHFGTPLNLVSSVGLGRGRD